MERYEVRIIPGSSHKRIYGAISSQPGVRFVGGNEHLIIEATPTTAERIEDSLEGRAVVRAYRGPALASARVAA